MKLIVREYCRNDYHAVDSLWKETGMGGAERGDDHKTIEETIKLGGKLFILENTVNHDIIGTAWMTYNGRRIYLHHFGIITNHQGNGYSEYLMKEVLAFVKTKGKQIKLEVHHSNKKAIVLYKKYGFKYLGDYKVFIIRDFNNVEI